MKFDEQTIAQIKDKNVSDAINKLKELECYNIGDIVIRSLNGWVFEQVITFCLKQELNLSDKFIEYQPTLKEILGKKKVDFLIKKVLLEVKTNSVGFGPNARNNPDDKEIKKHRDIREKAKNNGYTYVLLGLEDGPGFISLAKEIWGDENCFFLRKSKRKKDYDIGSWEKFVSRIKYLIE